MINAQSPLSSRALRRALLAMLALQASLGVEAHGQSQAHRFQVPETSGMRWFRGNTHTHTTESDGDSSPEYVARWYKERGFHFLVLSDHNVLTDTSLLAHLVDSTFLLIPGEEVSSDFEGKSVHVNGLNIAHPVERSPAVTVAAALQENVDRVRAAGGVPHINHPNYLWSLTAEDLAGVRDCRLIEIFNGHPAVHNLGGGDSPGMEAVWDRLLTMGRRVYGIAVDDAHHFQREFSRYRINPGRGWIVVRVRHLDAAELMESLEAGLFYASTGVELSDVVVTPDRLEVHIEQRGNFKYRTTFIGDGGRVLLETGESPAVFDLSGSAGGEPLTYVRAKVVDSGGAVAWVQPVFMAR